MRNKIIRFTYSIKPSSLASSLSPGLAFFKRHVGHLGRGKRKTFKVSSDPQADHTFLLTTQLVEWSKKAVGLNLGKSKPFQDVILDEAIDTSAQGSGKIPSVDALLNKIVLVILTNVSL